MKQLIVSFIFLLFSCGSFAQLTAFEDNFNTTCIANGNVPYIGTSGWMTYCKYLENWACTATDGRNGTAGAFCTNIVGSTKYLDTAYLISPKLDLTGTTGNLYLQWDSKLTNFVSGAKLTVIYQWDTTANLVPDTGHLAMYSNLQSLITPSFSEADSVGWVTHQIDITAYKNLDFFIAFRYTGSITTGNIWYIDNVNITDTPLAVVDVSKETMPLTVIGNSTSGQIQLTFTVQEAGKYKLSVYDVMGREVFSDNIYAASGTSRHTISDIALHSGMYFIKMGNGSAYGTAKTVVW